MCFCLVVCCGFDLIELFSHLQACVLAWAAFSEADWKRVVDDGARVMSGSGCGEGMKWWMVHWPSESGLSPLGGPSLPLLFPLEKVSNKYILHLKTVYF